MRPRIGTLLIALLSFGVGCSSQSPSPTSRGNDPPPIPGSVATTDWRNGENPPEGFGPEATGFASAHDLLRALMEDGAQADGGLEDGARLQGDILEEGAATATAWLQYSGILDDSIAGYEFRLLMRKALAGWYVESFSWRSHCRRGVDRPADVCL